MSTPAGQSNLDKITATLRSWGLGSVQIAGVEGNLQTESGFSPTAYNPREGAVGIAQWEGGRRTGLQQLAASRGTAETDLDTQLAFLHQELWGPESGALRSLLAATTPAQAATVFDQQYERSSAASLPARVANAQALARGGLQGGAGATAPAAGSGITAQPAGLMGDLLGGIADALGLTTIGHWIVDGALIIIGAALVIVGIVVLAKGADSHSSTVTVAPAAGSSAGKAGAEGTAEDAAEVAAA